MVILILAAAKLLAPTDPPTFSGTTTRAAAAVALCYAEQFGRQRDLHIATTHQENGYIIALTSRSLFKEVEEGRISIEDSGDKRELKFWFRRVKSDRQIPDHLRKCIDI
jgi:hypothetical protein